VVRSYEVDVHLDENLFGFYLLCYEGDDVVHEQFFRDSSDAHAMGNRFLDGLYVKGFPLEELV
jgi:hypothetical protein